MVTFRKSYFILALILFTVEVLIALFLHDGVIRNYVGDFLVVILLYCFVRTFLKVAITTAALGVLLFSYMVEFSQYFNLIKYLGLERSNIANTVMGHSFEWADMIAYTLGTLIVILAERIIMLKYKGEHQTNVE